MRVTVCTLAVGLAAGFAVPVAAQSTRIYVGASAGVEAGSHGPVDLSSVRTLGGAVGIHVAGGWSIEFEADQGFGSTQREDGEVFWLSYAPPGSSREEIERLAIRARFTRIDSAGTGYTARAVWRTREPGRVNVALFAGVAQRSFKKRVIRTITHIPEDSGAPPDSPNLRDADETRTIVGGGLTGGLMIPVKLTGAVSIAPDVRFTFGLIGDESTYRIFRGGVRVLWRF